MVTRVPLPGYTVESEPDHRGNGRKVDDVIRAYFAERTIVARGVSADDHPDLSVDELADIITSTGSDRYDPARVGDRYGNVEGKHLDLFGVRRTVTPRMRLFADLSWGFYHGAIAIHGQPTRLDLVSIYDATHLRAVRHRYEGRIDSKRDGFRFVDPDRKARALLGLIWLDR